MIAAKVSAIHELRPQYPLGVLLKVAGVARSTYFYQRAKSGRADKYTTLKCDIVSVFRKHQGRYGYRRITAVLRKNGLSVNHKTVRKLMGILGLACKVRHKKYNSYTGEVGKTAPNLLQRHFTAQRPLEKLVTDVTEFHLFGQKIYLSSILDLYNREIVSYNISMHPNLGMVLKMLRELMPKLKTDRKVLIHSDQGSIYQSKEYQNMLRKNGIIQSMSRKANCWDNAVIENFFGTIKSELLYLKDFVSVKQCVKEIKRYIRYYNEERIKLNLGAVSPVEYKNMYYENKY